MKLILRFLVLQSFLAWQGGFFFYATFVVPIATEVLESAALQGAVTQRVTNWLNLLGVISLGLMLVDHLRETHIRRWRWACWVLMAVSQTFQMVLHAWLDSQFDPSTLSFTDRPRFYFWHEAYLIAASVQWFAGLVWLWLTLRCWTTVRKESP